MNGNETLFIGTLRNKIRKFNLTNDTHYIIDGKVTFLVHDYKCKKPFIIDFTIKDYMSGVSKNFHYEDMMGDDGVKFNTAYTDAPNDIIKFMEENKNEK